MSRNYEVIGEITGIETIAIGRRIRELPALQERFGRGRWCKLKGIAQVCLADMWALFHDFTLHYNTL